MLAARAQITFARVASRVACPGGQALAGTGRLPSPLRWQADAMALDSKAAFLERVREIGLERYAEKLANEGWATFG
eukprot:8009827-Alexandrium_andersonii.AAC.1